MHRLVSYGEFVFMDLEFLNYVRYGGEDPGRTAAAGGALDISRIEREKYHERIAAALPSLPNKPKEPYPFLVVGTSARSADLVDVDDEKIPEKTASSWYRIVHLLADLADFKGVCFYRLASIAESTPRSKPLVPSGLADGSQGYAMKAGRDYGMTVLYTIPSSLENAGLPFAMHIESMPSHLRPMRERELVDGPYDLMTFRVHALAQPDRRTSSLIGLQSEQKLTILEDGTPRPPGTYKNPIDVPPNIIPVEIRWTFWAQLWRNWVPPVAAALGLGLWFTAPWVATWPTTIEVGLSSETLRYVSIFVLAFAFQNWSAFTGQFKVKSETAS
jgi:hypothetical protein